MMRNLFTKKSFRVLIFTIAAFLTCISFTACGGGSSGTGTGSTTIEGTVKSEEGEPLAGITVTIIETGDNDITDDAGFFSITSDIETSEVTLEILKDENSLTVELSNVSNEESATLEVEIEVSEDLKEISVTNLEVSAKIAGFCDLYFENRRVIRQSNSLPAEETKCTAKVSVKGDGKGLGGVPFIIESRRCREKGSEWTRLAQGMTRSDQKSLGTGQAQFSFINSKQHCVYRIVAPYNLPNLQEVTYFIHSFKKQEFDRNRK